MIEPGWVAAGVAALTGIVTAVGVIAGVRVLLASVKERLGEVVGDVKKIQDDIAEIKEHAAGQDATCEARKEFCTLQFARLRDMKTSPSGSNGSGHATVD